jgi:hypothetical protein
LALLLSPELLELQDQDSWGGSGGHSIGDALVTGLFPGQTEALKCRRSHLKCNAVCIRENLHSEFAANFPLISFCLVNLTKKGTTEETYQSFLDYYISTSKKILRDKS